MNKNIVILNFSPRNDGNCGKICDYLSDFYKRTNVRSFKIEMNPCAGCDYECLKPDVVCPIITQAQKEIMDAITESELVYYIVPNFCGYPCANFFAFNERSVGYFNQDRNLLRQYMSVQKRFILVSNSEGDSFRNAMKQQTSEEPVMLYLKSGKYKKRSTDGNILESEEAQKDLLQFLERNG